MDFIEHLRGKPEHTRKQVAFGAAAGFTLLVTFMWGVAFVSSGALSTSSNTASNPVVSTFSPEKGVSLLSAVGALTTRQDGSITVVGASATSSVPNKTTEDRTVIPF